MNTSLIEKAGALHQESQNLEEQIGFIDQQLVELKNFEEDLGYLQKTEEHEILAPLGKGVFMKSEFKDKKLFVDVGAGVIVHKSPEEVSQILKQQIMKLGEMRLQLEMQLHKITEEFQTILHSLEARAQE